VQQIMAIDRRHQARRGDDHDSDRLTDAPGDTAQGLGAQHKVGRDEAHIHHDDERDDQ
jgi:hypothetical protein